MCVWQSQAPAGTSKFTDVAGWDAFAWLVRVCRMAPVASVPTSMARRVSMGCLLFWLSFRSPFPPERLRARPVRRRACRTLYAAGELTRMAGGHINGKAGLEGTMLGPALFSGRVAGAWAAYEAGYGKGFVGQAGGR